MKTQVEGFTVTGFHVRTQNRDEFNETTAKLPSLWQQFYTSELGTNTHIFGVYSNYDSDANGPYTVTVGFKSNDVKTPLSSVAIQAGHYLVFQGTGPMPATVVEAWKQVWAFFETNTEHQRNFISDFESYSSPDQVAIYIGLK
ncbi:MAG: transcriptional regulator [Legionella sp.]|nr:MAG: transcriptional regulator [Legionella sp.]